MKTLLIDNYDSFSYNLYQFLAEVNGCVPHVIHNDTVPWEILKNEVQNYENIVISPGPGLSSIAKGTYHTLSLRCSQFLRSGLSLRGAVSTIY